MVAAWRYVGLRLLHRAGYLSIKHAPLRFRYSHPVGLAG